MLKSLWTPSSYQAESALKGMSNGKHRQQMGGEEHPFPSYFGHHANEWICGQLMFLNGAAHVTLNWQAFLLQTLNDSLGGETQ